uniref:Uncharacterized protein n=7 Tax=Fusarium TaxID=5506 RepID=A0A2C8D3V2_FUSOX|nr:hypothetical protein [Fusarium ramigenum]QTK22401.1 hypothetical protein [Fusarium oxysporum f. sp. albedinis]SNU76834.1 TPA: hypothetical protein [Fusarium oxysporum f. sp. lycopersici]SNU77058.1 TPA: hypothetical protein [Fusarium oxysporum f. sp. cucumerinum]SNU77665.1 TPA: hypothetical protein [Fusarium oxysporum f. sp. niveum]SNU77835.1 TPA: hypothetical protein [Fusarium oxysporum]SNU78072.1 TPA: hypothetical protein [Fusarium oxysporum PHW808]
MVLEHLGSFYKNLKWQQWWINLITRGNYNFSINNSDIMFLLTINNNSKNKDLTHLVAKMAVLNNPVENNLLNIAKYSSDMNLDTFYIFSIVIDDSFECKITEVDYPCKVKYIEVGISFFIENFLGSENINFWHYNKNTLYILRNGNYSDVKELFVQIQDIKVQVVRGSSQKAHLISPIDFRLSSYLLILFGMNYKKFNSENAFNIIQKDRYLPSSK